MPLTYRPSPLSRTILASLVCGSLTIPARAAPAPEPQTFKADYAVTIYGLTVARSQFTSRVSPDSFKLEGSISSAGLAVIFDNTKAKTVATGRFSKDATLPDDYSVSYTFGKKVKRTTLAFADGKVSKVTNVPPLQKRGKDWVPLSGKDLLAVTDPISAVLVRAPSLDQVCRRTIKVFDGELRADLKLSPVGTGPVDTDVYKGDAAVCSGKFVPISGYRPGNKSIRYLRDRSDIRITFAPLGETGVYAPIHATVGTQIGTVTFRARQIEAIK